MEELWDTYTQVMATVFSLAIAIYAYRLSTFFRGGIFYGSFRLLAPAFTIYSLGSFTDIFALLGVVPSFVHAVHFVSYAIFFSLATYSIYLLYAAWRSMGMGTV